jgi:hypothetical protein
MVRPARFPTARFVPPEGFPSPAAVPRHRGRCLPAVLPQPFPRFLPYSLPNPILCAFTAGVVDFKALLRLRVRNVEPPLPVVRRPILPGLGSPSRSFWLRLFRSSRRPEPRLPDGIRIAQTPPRIRPSAIWTNSTRGSRIPQSRERIGTWSTTPQAVGTEPDDDRSRRRVSDRAPASRFRFRSGRHPSHRSPGPRATRSTHPERWAPTSGNQRMKSATGVCPESKFHGVFHRTAGCPAPRCDMHR